MLILFHLERSHHRSRDEIPSRPLALSELAAKRSAHEGGGFVQREAGGPVPDLSRRAELAGLALEVLFEPREANAEGTSRLLFRDGGGRIVGF